MGGLREEDRGPHPRRAFIGRCYSGWAPIGGPPFPIEAWGASPAYIPTATGRVEAPSYSRRLNGGFGGFGGFCSSSARRRLARGVTTAIQPAKKSRPSASKFFAVCNSSSSSRVALPATASLSRSRRSFSVGANTGHLVRKRHVILPPRRTVGDQELLGAVGDGMCIVPGDIGHPDPDALLVKAHDLDVAARH